MVTRYAPPNPSDLIDLDLSRNEGSAWFLESVGTIDELVHLGNRYPRTDKLRTAIADRHKIDESQVLVTAGGDDALARCFFSRAGRSFVTTAPTFEMIGRYADQSRSVRTEISWWDGPFPVDELAAAAAVCDFSVIVSPNNPTGQAIGASQLQRVAEASPLLVLDAAYVDFADEDLTSLALSLGNVVVVRTLSKAFGLAGLRVGYLLGPRETVDEISAFGSPYPVSGISSHLAERALTSDPAPREHYVSEVKSERRLFQDVSDELGLESLPSQANFVSITSADPDWVSRGMKSLGIGVRAFPGREGLEQTIRVTLPGNDPDFSRLLASIKTVLAPQCLLFDLDGVIVDVSQSYDLAIIATAASFGVKLNRAQIAAEKARGGANDDWRVTTRLCLNSGIDVTLDEVISLFEAVYQGTDGNRALKLSETLLVDLETLNRWKKRFPLGVVTGRPRADAEDVLERLDLADKFDTVVTRDDTAMKPDPAPVRLAMANLGVDQGWMLGDTVDDLEAARRAGVLPIGVLNSDDESTRRGLAAAAAILTYTAQLEELLQ